MIVVNTSDSKIFECAYFIMRNEPKPSASDRGSLVGEANRIVLAAEVGEKRDKKARRRKGLGFVKFLLLISIIAVSMILGRLSHFVI